jgi:hypothetical protein
VERDKPKKNRNRLDKLCRSCHGNKKGGFKIFFGFLSSNFIGISTTTAAFEILKKFKMAAVAMVIKVQNMLNSLQTADPFET